LEDITITDNVFLRAWLFVALALLIAFLLLVAIRYHTRAKAAAKIQGFIPIGNLVAPLINFKNLIILFFRR
jgi:hypothetical protein